MQGLIFFFFYYVWQFLNLINFIARGKGIKCSLLEDFTWFCLRKCDSFNPLLIAFSFYHSLNINGWNMNLKKNCVWKFNVLVQGFSFFLKLFSPGPGEFLQLLQFLQPQQLSSVKIKIFLKDVFFMNVNKTWQSALGNILF